MKNRTSVHTKIILILTICIVGITIESVIQKWEFWVPPLLIFGVITLWVMHLSQYGQEKMRENVILLLSFTSAIFHGVHNSSFFDISAANVLLTVSLSLLGSEAILNFTLVEYLLVLFVQLVLATYYHTIELDYLNISKVVLHTVIVFSVHYVCRWIMFERKKLMEFIETNDKLMQAEGIPYVRAEDPAATISYIACDGRYLGAVLIRDRVKKDAADAVRRMKAAGVSRVVMLTGDRHQVGEAVAEEIGLDGVRSELMPQQKVDAVEALLGELSGRQRLAYIGDGINDAPVLTRADVGIAMGSMGSDAAIEAADIVIMDDDLMRIPAVTGIARKTVGIARQNIVIALAVKLLVLLLGAVGAANMWAAVFADVGVCVICILNSMRLLAVKKTIS